MNNSFIFGACDKKEIQIVIDCMEVRTIEEGEYVIKQGEEGDYFYVIEEGLLDCYKTFTSE